MNEDLYDYNELKEDIGDDIKIYMNGGDTFEQAVSRVDYELNELADSSCRPNEVMIYIILMLECMRQSFIISFVEEEYLKIIRDNEINKIKEFISNDDYNSVMKDILFIKGKLHSKI
jgi:hypothetical protein